MHPALRALCSAVIIMEGLVILWLAKMLGELPGIDSFMDGVHAVIDTLLHW